MALAKRFLEETGPKNIKDNLHAILDNQNWPRIDSECAIVKRVLSFV